MGRLSDSAVGEGVRNKLENIFNPRRSRIHGYVRADADLHVGNDLVVIPDDALIEGEPGTRENDNKPATEKVDETEHHGWSERASAESTRSSIWTLVPTLRSAAHRKLPRKLGLNLKLPDQLRVIGRPQPWKKQRLKNHHLSAKKRRFRPFRAINSENNADLRSNGKPGYPLSTWLCVR